MRASVVVIPCLVLVLMVTSVLEGGGVCGGGCDGQSSESGSLSGPCAVPCSIPNYVLVDVKTDARNNAHKICVLGGGDPNCQCTNGSYSTLSQTCTTVTDPETHEQTCEFSITIQYSGQCTLSG